MFAQQHRRAAPGHSPLLHQHGGAQQRWWAPAPVRRPRAPTQPHTSSADPRAAPAPSCRCQAHGQDRDSSSQPSSPQPEAPRSPASTNVAQQQPPPTPSTSTNAAHQSESSSTSHSSSNGGAPPGSTQPTLLSEVDRRLLAVWEDVKRDMRRDVDPELAQVLDTMSYEELTSSNPKRFFKKLADKLLGPTMAAMGLEMDPLEFLLEMIKLATFLQFVACGLVWYGSQGLGHADVGDAAKATLGLAIGCLTRPAFKVEHLLYPVYNSILQLFVPNGAFVLPSSSREEVQSTANKLGVTLALAFLLPQLLWGWDSLETAVLVGPLCAGWIVFDLSYMGAMMLIISDEVVDVSAAVHQQQQEPGRSPSAILPPLGQLQQRAAASSAGLKAARRGGASPRAESSRSRGGSGGARCGLLSCACARGHPDGGSLAAHAAGPAAAQADGGQEQNLDALPRRRGRALRGHGAGREQGGVVPGHLARQQGYGDEQEGDAAAGTAAAEAGRQAVRGGGPAPVGTPPRSIFLAAAFLGDADISGCVR